MFPLAASINLSGDGDEYGDKERLYVYTAVSSPWVGLQLAVKVFVFPGFLRTRLKRISFGSQHN
jgi:hypothetical protein